MTAATMRRSAHGLDSESGGMWRLSAACARGDLDSHILDGALGAGVRVKVARAIHICGHCPVRAACLRDAEQARPVNVVQGGKHWVRTRDHHYGTPSVVPLTNPGCGPWCAAARGIRPIWRQP